MTEITDEVLAELLEAALPYIEEHEDIDKARALAVRIREALYGVEA